MSKFCTNNGIKNLDEANSCGKCDNTLNINKKRDTWLEKYDEIINSRNEKVVDSFYASAEEFILGYLESHALIYYDIDEIVMIYCTIAVGVNYKTEFRNDYDSVPSNLDLLRLLTAGLLEAIINKSENRVTYSLSDIMKKLLILLNDQVDSSDDELQKTMNEMHKIRSKYYSMTFPEILKSLPSKK
ncbi:MAG: hypothetical protein ABFS12_17655 [Bacteroidota bacterium]